MRLIVLVVSLLLVSGCALQKIEELKIKADASETRYRDCLERNMKKPSKCESLRLIYELDRSKHLEKSQAFRNAMNQLGEIDQSQPVRSSINCNTTHTGVFSHTNCY